MRETARLRALSCPRRARRPSPSHALATRWSTICRRLASPPTTRAALSSPLAASSVDGCRGRSAPTLACTTGSTATGASAAGLGAASELRSRNACASRPKACSSARARRARSGAQGAGRSAPRGPRRDRGAGVVAVAQHLEQPGVLDLELRVALDGAQLDRAALASLEPALASEPLARRRGERSRSPPPARGARRTRRAPPAGAGPAQRGGRTRARARGAGAAVPRRR